MLQLHLHDKHFHYLLRCDLYQRFGGISATSDMLTSPHHSNQQIPTLFTVPVHTGSVGLKLQDTFKSGYSKFGLTFPQIQGTEWRRNFAQTKTRIASWYVQKSVVTDLLEYQSKEMDLVSCQVRVLLLMMASSHFPRYWPCVREFAGHRWIPRTMASDAELWCFLWSAPEWKVE